MRPGLGVARTQVKRAPGGGHRSGSVAAGLFQQSELTVQQRVVGRDGESGFAKKAGLSDRLGRVRVRHLLPLRGEPLHLGAVIDLRGERRAGQAGENFRERFRLVPIRPRQPPRAIGGRRPGRCPRRAGRHAGRQELFHAGGERLSEQIVAPEVQVNVFVKQISAGQTVRALLRENFFGVRQNDPRRFLSAGLAANLIVERAVATKAQRVEIARGLKMRRRFRRRAEGQREAGLTEPQFGKVVAPQRRLAKGGGGFLKLARLFGGQTGGEKLFPLRPFRRAEVRAMGRGKGRAVLQVDRHRAHDQTHARLPSDGQQVGKVLLEVPIDTAQARLIRAHLLIEKHGHAAPFARRRRAFLPPHAQRLQRLPGAGGLKREARADDRPGRNLRAKNRAGSERADHFVVAHVDHPDVAPGAGAVARDGQDDVGVDAGHGGVHHLEARARIAQTQHRFEHAGQARARLRIAVGGGFAEDKNPHRALGPGPRDGYGMRGARPACAEKAPAKLIVLHQRLRALME